MTDKHVRAKVFRQSARNRLRRIDTFNVPYRKGMTVHTLLQYIYEHSEPSLAFRDYRCGRGICNACRLRINGRVSRSCERLVRPGEEVLLEPINDRIIRDLVVEGD